MDTPRTKAQLQLIASLLKTEGGRDKFATSIADVLRRKPVETRFETVEGNIKEVGGILGGDAEQLLREVFEVAKTRI